MYDLKTMVVLTRTRLKDLRVKTFPEFEIIAFLNEGKNELVKIIRGSVENYFEESISGTLSTTTVPNAASITLPSDFAELRNLQITSSGYEASTFIKLNQSDNRFHEACIDGNNSVLSSNCYYYDFVGQSEIIIAPPPVVDLVYKMDYIKTVPDMMFPQDYPVGIPREHWDYIVTWAVCEGLRSMKDPRLSSYEDKLKLQSTSVINAINTRQVKEPMFVKGFMEDMW